MSRQDLPEPASWWVTLPDGGVRRIWVRKEAEVFHCRIEICNALQEAARRRLFDAVFALQAEGTPPPAAAARDALTWATAVRRSLSTANVSEAYTFLGDDDAALNALIGADPALGAGPRARPALVVRIGAADADPPPHAEAATPHAPTTG
jgi:hypothetical protein